MTARRDTQRRGWGEGRSRRNRERHGDAVTADLARPTGAVGPAEPPTDGGVPRAGSSR
ncbi:hypothetical protein Tchar_00583 [Tepidimonas charontis]|uniref:Uncharacterized protein n=1 Tax=Tepidimonas charontis TaxID=2267262 RepID=A0A554XID7_9BURK|nr:hypothetical protein Tchar_00583 [Tepidimonas charontis]